MIRVTRSVRVLSMLTIFGSVLALSQVPDRPSAAAAAREGTGKSGFVPGEVIVELKDAEAAQARGRLTGDGRVLDAQTGIGSLDALGRRFGVREMVPFVRGSAFSTAVRRSPLAGFFLLKLGAGHEATGAAAEYRKDAAVRSAQLNYIYTPDLVPNDTLYPQQYSHQVTHAEAGWDITTGQGTTRIAIGVIGEGTQLDHPDLASQIYTNTREIPGNGIDDDGNGFIDDVHGWDFASNDNDPSPGSGEIHETEVSGVAAAATNNALGVAGVCWGCQLMPLRIDYTTLTVSQAIDYAVANGARVVNMSFGNYDITKYGPDTAVGTSVNNGVAGGVVMVATAGNDSISVKRYPGALDNVIDVASTDSNDQRSGFSNFGSWIDVAAPGSSVESTTPTSTYASVSGTSFSSPYIAGVAGLILSQNSALAPTTVEQMIEYSSDRISTDHFIGTGRVNVAAALGLNGAPTLAAVIKSPENSQLAGGSVAVWGTAIGSSYILEWKLSSTTTWTQFGNGAQKINDTLGTLDFTPIPVAANVDLRLTAFSGGAQQQHQITVFNAGAQGWRQTTLTNTGSSPVYADLDGDGKPEVIVGTTAGYVYIFKQDGTPFPGWPKVASGYYMYGSPAVGDIDGDGIPEIVATNFTNGKVNAWHRDGSVVNGFPVDVGTNSSDGIRGSAALANLDMTPALEIAVVTLNGQVSVLNGSGFLLAGWPKATETNNQNSPAVGDVDGDGQPEIVIRGYYHLYVFNPDGTTVPGWPVPVGSSQAPPVLADLNRSGPFEIVTQENPPTGLSGKVTAFDGAGNLLFSTVVTTSSSMYGALGLGDLDDDGKPEIFAIDYSGKVYALNAQGAVLPGWPVSTGGQISGSPVIADIDGDGQKEVTVAATDGKIYSWNADGSLALGPIALGATFYASPAVGDLDADGDVDLISHNSSGVVNVIDLGVAWSAGKAHWPMFQGNAQHTGLDNPDSDQDGDPDRTDCAILDPTIHHGAAEVCNNKDDNCDGRIDEGFDADGDGVTTCALPVADCNDANPSIYPGAPEICDHIDDNCNGLVDEGLDKDGDGYTPCALPVGDCNDNNAAVHPGATEVCNNVDDNCNGLVDEGFDADHDGWTTCALPIPDCNDNDARINGIEISSVNKSCFDQLDNDCDGVVDWDCAIDVGSVTNEVVQYGSVSPQQPAGLANMSAGSANNTYESISETNVAGTRRLSVYWTFANPNFNNWWALRVEGFRATSGDSYTFSVAQRTQTGACGPTTGETYTTAFTVSKTSDDDRLQVYQIGPPNGNTVAFCVHVVDTITSKDTTIDTLAIDKLYLMPILLDANADSETTAIGTHVNGTSYVQTLSGDSVYEILQEGTGDALDNTWRFPTVPVGYSHVLHFQGYRTSSTGGDDFQFYYATPDPLNPTQPGPFQVITGAVVNTSRGGQTSDWTFGPQSTTAPLYGTVWIKVLDTVPGGATLDKLYIDYMAIRATP